MTEARWRAALVVATACTVVLVASTTDRVFDAPYNPVIAMAVPLLAAAVALVNPWKRIIARVLPQVVVCLVATGLAVSSRSGNIPDDIGGAFLRGLARVISARWPAPSEPVSVGGVVLVVALASSFAAEVAWSRRYAGVLLIPSSALLVLVALLAPTAGPPSMFVVIPLAALGALVLRLAYIVKLLRTDRGSNAERGTNALVASVIGLVALLPVAFGAPFGTTERFDVRDLRDHSSDIDEEISLLSRLDEWRSLDPVREMFSLAPADPDTRWRVAALTRYDGRSWMPSKDFRPIGSELGPRLGQVPLERYRVTMGELDDAWLPFAGEPIAVDLAARVDPTRSGIRGDQTFASGEEFDITVIEPEPTIERLDLASANRDLGVASSVEIPLSPELATLGSEITAGATGDRERAQLLADYLQQNYQFDEKAPAGHGLAQVRLFLLTSKRGRDEQFVAAYALLARSIGLPVRIAVGFDMVEDGEGRSVARSDNAVAWPEVAFERLGWVPFDPIPPENTTLAPNQASVGQTGNIVVDAPIPPTTAPVPVNSDQDQVLSPELTESESLSVAGRMVLAGLLLCVALAAYVVVVLMMKRNRRARRTAALRADERIAGAFISGVELAIDLGANTGPSLTNRELAVSSLPVVGGGATDLQSLAALATRAVYDSEEPGEEAVSEAWIRERSLRSETARGVGRVRWYVARISPRSLRGPRLDEGSTADPRR